MREFTAVERLLAPLGYKREDLADRYVYEIAGLLGVGEPEREESRGNTGASRARSIERLRAHAEGMPEPEPQAPSGGLSMLMAQGAV